MRSVQRDGLQAAVLRCLRLFSITLPAAVMCLAMHRPAQAQEDEDLLRSVTLTCSFTDYPTFTSETAEVHATPDDKGQAAGSRRFRSGEKDASVNFRVKPGEFAECVFPSGHSVRVKTGEGATRLYGPCGGNPEIFSSIWVNQRKIASREWFAGHCHEDSDMPDLSYTIYGTVIDKCATARADAGTSTAEHAKAPPAVCLRLPDLSRYPKDQSENWTARPKRRAVGDVELLVARSPVCEAARPPLRRNFYFFGWDQSNVTSSSGIGFPDWQPTDLPLPEELAGDDPVESQFDMDNDGQLDLVVLKSFQNHYMDGSVLLFKPSGKAPRPKSPIEMTSDDWTFYPCQLGAAKAGVTSCPPFSQEHDSKSFTIAKGQHRASYDFRYSQLTPFRFHGTTYLGVNAIYDVPGYYAAILQPLPHKRWAPVCLFQRVEENF